VLQYTIRIMKIKFKNSFDAATGYIISRPFVLCIPYHPIALLFEFMIIYEI